MADVIHLNDFRPSVLNPDGGKSRIQRRRSNMRIRIEGQPRVDLADDLIMDHVDTSLCEMAP
ncbi:MAG: hypothetical protein JWL86_792 [Rhizobium sp.]|nr:hypothetical protein [Rhizobium sp.]